MIRVGNPLPEIDGSLSDGRSWSSTDALGRPLVLYFYPKDFTPECTVQACSFRDAYASLRQDFGAVLIGVSRDPAETHEQFRLRYRLPFPLLTDAEGSIARRFGAVYLGGLLPFNRRMTFVADPEGILRGIFRHEFLIGRHARSVRKCLEQFDRRPETVALAQD